MSMEKSRILDLYKKEIISLEEATELLDAMDEVMPEEEIREEDRQRRDSNRRTSEFMQNLRDSTSKIVDETRDFLRSEKVRDTTEKAANTVKDVFTSIFTSISDTVGDIYSGSSAKVDGLEIEVIPSEDGRLSADGYSQASAQSGQPAQHFDIEMSVDGLKIDDRTISSGTSATFAEGIFRVVVRVPEGIFASINRQRKGKTLLRARLSGSSISIGGINTFIAESDVGDTSVDVSGCSKAFLNSLQGSSRVTISGACEFCAVTADCQSLKVTCSGSSSFKVRDGGSIGNLTISVSGASDASIRCTVGGGEADASGVSSIHIANVTGGLNQRISGVSSISCGA